MTDPRYTTAEMNQWHDACPDSAAPQKRTRQKGARQAMAKGQAERTMNQSAARTAAQGSAREHEEWASECLFDCYNG